MSKPKIKENKSVKHATGKSTSGYSSLKNNPKLKKEIREAVVAISIVLIVSFIIFIIMTQFFIGNIIHDPGKSNWVYAACSVIIGYVIVYGIVKIFKNKKK